MGNFMKVFKIFLSICIILLFKIIIVFHSDPLSVDFESFPSSMIYLNNQVNYDSISNHSNIIDYRNH